METETTKTFDSVAFMRAARQRLGEELAGKSFEQQHALLSRSIPSNWKQKEERPATRC